MIENQTSKKLTCNSLRINLLLGLIIFISGFSFAQETDQQPKYMDGRDALINHIGQRLEFPKECRSQNLEGIAYVSIRVNSEGDVDLIEVGQKGHVMPEFLLSTRGTPYPDARPITEGPSVHFDEAVAVALEGLGKFHPAMKDGTPVTSWITFPVSFNLFQCKKEPILLSKPTSTP